MLSLIMIKGLSVAFFKASIESLSKAFAFVLNSTILKSLNLNISAESFLSNLMTVFLIFPNVCKSVYFCRSS